MNKVVLGGAVLVAGLLFCCPKVGAVGYEEFGQYGRPGAIVIEDTEEQIQEEIKLGEMELLAQLVEAEAGNQCFEGKCLVVDVCLTVSSLRNSQTQSKRLYFRMDSSQ